MIAFRDANQIDEVCRILASQACPDLPWLGFQHLTAQRREAESSGVGRELYESEGYLLHRVAEAVATGRNGPTVAQLLRMDAKSRVLVGDLLTCTHPDHVDVWVEVHGKGLPPRR